MAQHVVCLIEASLIDNRFPLETDGTFVAAGIESNRSGVDRPITGLRLWLLLLKNAHSRATIVGRRLNGSK